MRAIASLAALSRSSTANHSQYCWIETTEVLQITVAIPDNLQLHAQIRIPGWSGSLQSPSPRRSELDDHDRCRPFSRWRHRGAVYVQLAQVLDRRLPLLDRDRPRNQHGIPSAAYPPGVQMPGLAGVFLCPLRIAEPRRRTDFLGRRAPHPSSEIRSAGRSPFTPVWRLLLVPHGLDHLRRRQPQQHEADVQIRARLGEASLLCGVE